MTHSSNSSSTSSLQNQPPNKRPKSKMKDTDDGSSSQSVNEPIMESQEDQSKQCCDKPDVLQRSATISLENPKDETELTTTKSPSCSAISPNPGQSVKSSLDVYSKGACSSIKSIFEENIAVKKGLKPDPNAPQGLVRVRSKVQTQLPSSFVSTLEKKGDIKKDPVVVDKIIFKKFLCKFETDQSRELAKSQLRQLTASQKIYNAKRSERLEDQRRQELEEAARLKAEEEAQRLREEEERRRKQEEEERKKKEEELQRIEAEKAALLAKKEAKKAAALAKKQAKLTGKKEVPQVQLPKLISTSFTDFKEKFQTKKSDIKPVPVVERPKVRKLIDNPFEQKMPMSDALEKKSSSGTFISAGSNRISEMKKRYSQLFTQPHEGAKTPNKLADKMEVDVPTGEPPPPPQPMEMPVEQPNPHTRALNKARESFLTRSKERIDKSCEKIIRFSKEKLNELAGNSKPSKDDMKCYLLSHILYDGEKAVANTKEETPKVDIEVDEDEELEKGMFEDEYIKGMEKYLACFDSDNKKSKSNKVKKKSTNFEPTIKLKTIEVNDIRKQFEKSHVKNVTDSGRQPIAFETSVGKVKDIFEKSETNSQNVESVRTVRKSGKLLSQDLLIKFDSPEKAAENRKRLEQEREERRLQRIAKLVDDMRRAEEEERRRAEEEVRRAEEMKRLEEERLERLQLEEEERQRIEAIRMAQQAIEDAKERAKQAVEDKKRRIYEDAVRETREKAEQRNQREALIKQQREKNEPAFKKRKVLGRIQHMFEKKLDDPGPVSRNKPGDAEAATRNFQDTTSSGLAQMLGRVKDKFEVKEEKPQTLFHGVTIAKKDIPAAETFVMIEQKQAEQVEVARPAASEDWAWKKKDPKQLAVESTIAMYGTSKETTKKKECHKSRNADQKNELYADITNLKSRLAKRDALKESEEKMKEYAKFMAEIQGYLNEPDSSVEEKSFKNDIQNYIQQAAATASKKKQARKKSGDPDIKFAKKEAIAKATYQWGNHLEEIRDLVDFLTACKNNSLSKLVSPYLARVAENLTDEDNNSAIEDFCNLMSGIHKFLNGPDTSKDEIDLKCDIEGYLDQIGEPVVEEERPPPKIGKTPRLPQKLNLDAFSFSMGQGDVSQVSDDKPRNRDSQVIKDLQMKLLFGERGKDQQPLSKDEFLVPNIAIDKLKKDYEKLQQQDDSLTLIPGPKVTLKRIEDTLPIPETSPIQAKPISTWKWKEKQENEHQETTRDLVSGQKTTLANSPTLAKPPSSWISKEKEPKEPWSSSEQPNNDAKKSELRLQADLENAKNMSKIKEQEEKRDKELEAFITSMEEILETNESSGKEAISSKKIAKKSGQANTIDNKAMKPLSITGSVSTIKTLLEQSTEPDKTGGDQSRPKVGKLNADFIESLQTNTNTNKAKIDPVVATVDAHKIKKKLEQQNPTIQETKVLFSAPKTRLKESLVLHEEKNDTIAVIGDLLREKRSSSVFVNRPVQQCAQERPNKKEQPPPKVSQHQSKPDDKKVYKSQYEQFKSEEEKKAAILAKYGVKPRLECNNGMSSSSSSSDEEDQVVIARKLAEQKEALKEMYGLNDIRERRKDRLEEKRIRDNSLSTLRNVLLKLRDAKGGSMTNLNEPDAISKSTLDLSQKRSMYSSTRALFENETKEEEDFESKEMLCLERSSTFSNMKSVFDSMESSSRVSRRTSRLHNDNDNRSSSNARSAYEAHTRSASATRTSEMFSPSKRNPEMAANPGFNKIRGAYLEKQTISSSTRALFDNDSKEEDFACREMLSLERSSTFSNVKSVFDQKEQSSRSSRRTSRFDNDSENRSFANAKSALEAHPRSASATRPSDIFSPSKRNSDMEVNPGFNKVRGAFERNIEISDDESSDDDGDDNKLKQKTTSLSQRDLIQAELDELRTLSRRNSVFRINHPRQDQSLVRSSSSTQVTADKLELDTKTLNEVSRNRQDMKKFFESSAPKVTFGGAGACAFSAEKAGPVPTATVKPVQQSLQSGGDRGWVYDVINKYFDVIEEDEEGSEDEDPLDEEEDDDAEDHEPFESQKKAENGQNKFYQIQPNGKYGDHENNDDDDDDDEEEEEDNESSEDECERNVPSGTQFGVMRSASSSKMRTLFRSVMERSKLGPDQGLQTFKTNLGSHLRDRGSTLSLYSGEPDDSNDYQENRKYQKIPL